MGLRKIAYIFPFFIIKKICLQFNPHYVYVELKFDENNKFPAKCFEIEEGIWILQSREMGLLQKKQKLESELRKINEELYQEVESETKSYI